MSSAVFFLGCLVQVSELHVRELLQIFDFQNESISTQQNELHLIREKKCLKMHL